jgi:hypothetical protein
VIKLLNVLIACVTLHDDGIIAVAYLEMCQRGGGGRHKKFDDLFSEGDEMSTKKFFTPFLLPFSHYLQPVTSPPFLYIIVLPGGRAKQGGGRALIDVLPMV